MFSEPTLISSASVEDEIRLLVGKGSQTSDLSDQVNPICQECGDSGYAELLIYCVLCQTSSEHSYCLGKTPKNCDGEVIWICEGCEETAGLIQGGQVTSFEDRSNSRKKLKY